MFHLKKKKLWRTYSWRSLKIWESLQGSLKIPGFVGLKVKHMPITHRFHFPRSLISSPCWDTFQVCWLEVRKTAPELFKLVSNDLEAPVTEFWSQFVGIKVPEFSPKWLITWQFCVRETPNWLEDCLVWISDLKTVNEPFFFCGFTENDGLVVKLLGFQATMGKTFWC